MHVSQYNIYIYANFGLCSSDFTSSTQECELPRTGRCKSGNSAKSSVGYLIMSVSLPWLYCNFPHCIYNETKYDIKHHFLSTFSFKHINSRRNVVQEHYNETKYYIISNSIASFHFHFNIKMYRIKTCYMLDLPPSKNLMFNHYRDISASGKCQKD